jgi:hypothetical protein
MRARTILPQQSVTISMRDLVPEKPRPSEQGRLLSYAGTNALVKLRVEDQRATEHHLPSNRGKAAFPILFDLAPVFRLHLMVVTSLAQTFQGQLESPSHHCWCL